MKYFNFTPRQIMIGGCSIVLLLLLVFLVLPRLLVGSSSGTAPKLARPEPLDAYSCREIGLEIQKAADYLYHLATESQASPQQKENWAKDARASFPLDKALRFMVPAEREGAGNQGNAFSLFAGTLNEMDPEAGAQFSSAGPEASGLVIPPPGCVRPGTADMGFRYISIGQCWLNPDFKLTQDSALLLLTMKHFDQGKLNEFARVSFQNRINAFSTRFIDNIVAIFGINCIEVRDI